MPDGKRHCAIVLTTDLQLSGCFRRLLPKGKRHCAVALTHITLRDLLLLLRCRRTVRGGVFLCHPAWSSAAPPRPSHPADEPAAAPRCKYLFTYLVSYQFRIRVS